MPLIPEESGQALCEFVEFQDAEKYCLQKLERKKKAKTENKQARPKNSAKETLVSSMHESEVMWLKTTEFLNVLDCLITLPYYGGRIVLKKSSRQCLVF